MKTLVKKCNNEIDDYLKEINCEFKLINSTDNSLVPTRHSYFQELYNLIYNHFSKLSSTTPKLNEIKNRVFDKIRSIENIDVSRSLNYAKNTFSSIQRSQSPEKSAKKIQGSQCKPPLQKKENNIDEKWIDSLLQEMDNKNIESSKKLEKSAINNSHNSKNSKSLEISNNYQEKYAEKKNEDPPSQSFQSNNNIAFERMESEFRLIKEMILKLNDEMKKHSHEEIRSKIENLNVDCIKLGSENEVLRNEHTEISQLIKILSKNDIAKRIDVIESDVLDLK